MTVGVVMMVHTALRRAAQVARYWDDHGCPVIIHVDKKVGHSDHQALVDSLKGRDNILFCERYACEWGTWSLVAASQAGAQMLLERFPEASHVFLSSGACLPLRSADDLKDYLAARPSTDFIESVTTEDVPWTVGGLDIERFTLRFPFSYKKQPRLFDRYVAWQRRVGFARKIPGGLVPHLGSQWWCLSRQTLTAIFEDPNRKIYDRYFRKVWIPDESYYQTLVRRHSNRVESRSLTLSKFDFRGQPHVFYDDHLQLLRRSDCFVARKIWPQADLLYDTFLSSERDPMKGIEPNPGKIDRIFSKALERRVSGRPGLYMQSRMPRYGKGHNKTSAPYSVFEGFTELFEDFEDWLGRTVNARVHGHLYAPERAEFAGRKWVFSGALSSRPALRDYNPCGFLTSLIWNTRGERQCFMFGPRDTQDINWLMTTDPNAQISVISGAWLIPLFRSEENFSLRRKEAARLQRIEAEHLDVLRSEYVKARVRIWTLSEFLELGVEPLREVIDDLLPRTNRHVLEPPKLRDLTGFSQFLQDLKNQGMNPYLAGDFSTNTAPKPSSGPRKRPYLVK